MIKPRLLLLLLVLTTGSFGQTSPVPSQTSSNPSTTVGQPLVRRSDSALRAQVFKNQVWIIENDEEKHQKYIRLTPLDSDQQAVQYLLPYGAVGEFGISAWKVRNDTFYKVVSPSTAPGNIGQFLTKTRVVDLIPVLGMIQKSGGVTWIKTTASYEMLPLTPLNKAWMFDTVTGEGRLTKKGPWYDFLVDEKENCKLIIIADGYLAVWEIESHDNWEPSSLEKAKIKRQSKPEPEWKRTAVVRAPFSGRFVADMENGILTIVSESGEVWQADSQYNLQKSESSVAAAPESPLLIEDTEAGEIWLASYPRTGSTDLGEPRLLKGRAATANDRVGKALKAIQTPRK